MSNEVLTEYEEILSLKTSPHFANVIIKTLINKHNLIKVSPTWRFHLIDADPDDNKFVDCAIAADAELIVTNDKHFDVLRTVSWPKLTIIKLNEFVALI